MSDFEGLRGIAQFDDFVAAIVALQDDEKIIALSESDPVKIHRAQGANAFAEKVLDLIGM